MPLPSKLLENCRALRRTQTKAEQLFWACLRNRQLFHAKFRRQHPIGSFVVDFFCQEANLVIELDGWSHDYQPRYDAIRQRQIEAQGITVLRFTNQNVLDSVESVLTTIASHLPPEMVGQT